MTRRHWLILGVLSLCACFAWIGLMAVLVPTVLAPTLRSAVADVPPAAAGTVAPAPTPTFGFPPTWTPTPKSANAPQPAATSAASNASAGPYDEKANAAKDIAAALAKAQADKKYVLLDFGANWCPDCLVLSTIFEDPSVQPFLDANFHTVRIDVGTWNKNLDISKQYGSPIDNGIPAVVVLDANGKIVATTRAGELANARTATAQDILAYLQKWAPKK